MGGVTQSELDGLNERYGETRHIGGERQKYVRERAIDLLDPRHEGWPHRGLVHAEHNTMEPETVESYMDDLEEALEAVAEKYGKDISTEETYRDGLPESRTITSGDDAWRITMEHQLSRGGAHTSGLDGPSFIANIHVRGSFTPGLPEDVDDIDGFLEDTAYAEKDDVEDIDDLENVYQDIDSEYQDVRSAVHDFSNTWVNKGLGVLLRPVMRYEERKDR